MVKQCLTCNESLVRPSDLSCAIGMIHIHVRASCATGDSLLVCLQPGEMLKQLQRQPERLSMTNGLRHSAWARKLMRQLLRGCQSCVNV